MSHAYLIIGASGGIGSELARRLVASGNRVLLGGRQETHLADLSRELQQPFMVADARDWNQTAAAVSQAVERFGRLDGAVNLAGSLLLKPAHLTSMEDWRETIDQNMTTAFGLVRAAAPAMRGSGVAQSY